MRRRDLGVSAASSCSGRTRKFSSAVVSRITGLAPAHNQHINRVSAMEHFHDKHIRGADQLRCAHSGWLTPSRAPVMTAAVI